MQLYVVADHSTPDHVEQRLERDPLGVEQELVWSVEDPEVAEQLALWGEERGVAAGPRGERLDVVGDLAVEERLGFAARERELPALGAVDDATAFGDGGVLGGRCGGGGHDFKIARPPRCGRYVSLCDRNRPERRQKLNLVLP